MPKQFNLINSLTEAQGYLAKCENKLALCCIRECLQFIAGEEARVRRDLTRKHRRKQLLQLSHVGQQILKDEE